MSLDTSHPIIYLVTPGDCEAENYAEQSQKLLDTAKAAVDLGIDVIQVREKRLSGKLLFELTQRLAEIVRESRTSLFVNDRLDIAIAAGGHGVHLTSTSVPVRDGRKHVPDGFIVGVSCHRAVEVIEAANAEADYVLYGPVFPTPGKILGIGLEDLNHACVVERRVPIIAIGGIDVNNWSYAIVAGASGFAAIRALNDRDSMRQIMAIFPR